MASGGKKHSLKQRNPNDDRQAPLHRKAEAVDRGKLQLGRHHQPSLANINTFSCPGPC